MVFFHEKNGIYCKSESRSMGPRSPRTLHHSRCQKDLKLPGEHGTFEKLPSTLQKYPLAY